MSKVLVERERLGGHNDRKGRPARNLEDLPSKESMKGPHKDRKSLNENLNPLKRYLHSQVGKHWDKVFSDISANLSTNSAVQKHVKDHIWDFVNKNVTIEGKKVFVLRRFYGKLIELYNGDLYIDPVTGVLKKYKVKKEKREKYNEFETLLQSLSNGKSSLLIEGDIVYKLYDDPKIEGLVIKQIAHAQHAVQDFKNSIWGNKRNISEFFFKFINRLDTKNPYWAKYIELVEKSKVEKENTKKESLFKEGVAIEFSKDGGKTFEEGIINRIEKYGEDYPEAYWISLSYGKNERYNPYISRHHIRIKK